MFNIAMTLCLEITEINLIIMSFLDIKSLFSIMKTNKNSYLIVDYLLNNCISFFSQVHEKYFGVKLVNNCKLSKKLVKCMPNLNIVLSETEHNVPFDIICSKTMHLRFFRNMWFTDFYKTIFNEYKKSIAILDQEAQSVHDFSLMLYISQIGDFDMYMHYFYMNACLDKQVINNNIKIISQACNLCKRTIYGRESGKKYISEALYVSIMYRKYDIFDYLYNSGFCELPLNFCDNLFKIVETDSNFCINPNIKKLIEQYK